MRRGSPLILRSTLAGVFWMLCSLLLRVVLVLFLGIYLLYLLHILTPYTKIKNRAFGCGKGVLCQSIAKYSNSDVLVYVVCGERGNDLAEVIMESSHTTIELAVCMEEPLLLHRFFHLSRRSCEYILTILCREYSTRL